jgi:hypothetical protein
MVVSANRLELLQIADAAWQLVTRRDRAETAFSVVG